MTTCKSIITALALLAPTISEAQISTWGGDETGIISTLESEEEDIMDTDTLSTDWKTNLNEFMTTRIEEPIETTEDIYWLTRQGIDRMYYENHPVFYQTIDEDMVRWIRYFCYYKKGRTQRTINRYRRIVDQIENCFMTYGVPAEVAILCTIESGCSYNAVSPVGATGLWQIMPGTGREYGLNVAPYQDDRLNPLKSTDAAAKILRNAYKRLGDWTLAMAAYNCGSGRILKAIKKNNSKDWNKIKKDLPLETQQYIPSIIAMHYAWCLYVNYP